MARARNIKPGFFKNEVLPDVDFQGRLLFIGLWTLADRAGRLEYRPRRIKGELFPYEECDVMGYVEQLEKLGFLLVYEVEGCEYIQIVNFDKHQNPHKNEKESTIPAPCEHRADREKAESDHADSLIPDSLIPESLPDSAEPPAAHAPAVEHIPLNDGSEFPITEDQVAEYQRLYPAVDVHQELRAMRGWCLANPTKRKTKRGVLKFVNAWLGREQDKPRTGGSNGTIHPRETAFERGKRKRAELERELALAEGDSSLGSDAGNVRKFLV